MTSLFWIISGFHNVPESALNMAQQDASKMPNPTASAPIERVPQNERDAQIIPSDESISRKCALKLSVPKIINYFF